MPTSLPIHTINLNLSSDSTIEVRSTPTHDYLSIRVNNDMEICLHFRGDNPSDLTLDDLASKLDLLQRRIARRRVNACMQTHCATEINQSPTLKRELNDLLNSNWRHRE